MQGTTENAVFNVTAYATDYSGLSDTIVLSITIRPGAQFANPIHIPTFTSDSNFATVTIKEGTGTGPFVDFAFVASETSIALVNTQINQGDNQYGGVLSFNPGYFLTGTVADIAESTTFDYGFKLRDGLYIPGPVTVVVAATDQRGTPNDTNDDARITGVVTLDFAHRISIIGLFDRYREGLRAVETPDDKNTDFTFPPEAQITATLVYNPPTDSFVYNFFNYHNTGFYAYGGADEDNDSVADGWDGPFLCDTHLRNNEAASADILYSLLLNVPGSSRALPSQGYENISALVRPQSFINNTTPPVYQLFKSYTSDPAWSGANWPRYDPGNGGAEEDYFLLRILDGTDPVDINRGEYYDFTWELSGFDGFPTERLQFRIRGMFAPLTCDTAGPGS